MRRAAARAGAAALLSLLSAIAVADLPDANEFTAQILDGLIDPEHSEFDDYWQVPHDDRFRWQLQVNALLGVSLDDPPGPISCDAVEVRRMAAEWWLGTLFESKNLATWLETRKSLQSRLATLDEEMASAARNAPAGSGDYRVDELKRRLARGAAIDARYNERVQLLVHSRHGDFDRDGYGVVALRNITIFCDNARWLRGQMNQIGWFDIPRFGTSTDEAAWRIAQYARPDEEFIRFVNKRIRSLPKGNTAPAHVAMVIDGDAINRSRKTKYGMYGQCLLDGTWKPIDVRDPRNLDKRRAAMGLEPMAEYAARMARETCDPPPN